MKVLYITTECKPFSKEGGIAMVAGELPPALKRKGIDIRVVTPAYDSVDPKRVGEKEKSIYVKFNGKTEKVDVHHGDIEGTDVILLKNETYFGEKGGKGYGKAYVHSEVPYKDDALRFSFLSESCLPLIDEMKPDIVHINDWGLCYLFGRMKTLGFEQKRTMTIHNVGYQGNLWIPHVLQWATMADILSDPRIGRYFLDPRAAWENVNALRLGLELSHVVNTVSPTYAEEMTKPENPGRYFEGGKGLEKICKRLYDEGRLIAILNGFVYKSEPDERNFQQKMEEKKTMREQLSKRFQDPNALILGFVGRAVEQKFRLLMDEVDGKSVFEHILDIPRINVALVATGPAEYERFLNRLKGRGNYLPVLAFDPAMAGQVNLGSDVFLMPSLYEPCGIAQMEAMANATPPLVRWTGGLADTVKPYDQNDGTGFGFDGGSKEAILRNLIATVEGAKLFFEQSHEKFSRVQKNAFRKRFTWDDAVKGYIHDLYEKALRLP